MDRRTASSVPVETVTFNTGDWVKEGTISKVWHEGAPGQEKNNTMIVMKKISSEAIRKLPKVNLHDHLDGGLRPRTIVELAKETNYNGLPTTDTAALADWFQTNANRGSLPLYLQGFEHTCG